MSDEKKLLNNDEHPFHPSDPPYGSKNYDEKALEPEQQEALNKIKLSQKQDNEVYLNNHPEIRGLVSMMIRLKIENDLIHVEIDKSTYFLRHLLDKEATSSQEIQSLLSTFFDRPRSTIAAELLDYFLENNYDDPIVESLKEEISESDQNNEE